MFVLFEKVFTDILNVKVGDEKNYLTRNITHTAHIFADPVKLINTFSVNV